jgi:Methane oxygenase PmoA
LFRTLPRIGFVHSGGGGSIANIGVTFMDFGNSRALRASSVTLFSILAVQAMAVAGGPVREDRLVLKVETGQYARQDTPVRVDLPAKALPAAVLNALGNGSKALSLQEIRVTDAEGQPITAQAERLDALHDGEDLVRLTWILTGSTPAHTSREFRLASTPIVRASSPWLIGERPKGVLDLTNRERTVFRYNMAPVSHPNFPPIETRNAYIHPAFTPSGALITGDFSTSHPHHRGFFLAYTKTQVGDLHPDFWNIQSGTGKISFDRLEKPVAGPVTARFSAYHRWAAKGKDDVLREKWDVEAYDIPGRPYWLFDLTSTQQATDKPLELPPYRYGGMAYRGAEPFVKGGIDVLTSDGRGRKERDQKPARWVDLTGPIADGSDQFAGAMIADHPQNLNHPTLARIHPTTLPFFTFVPSHDKTVTIGTDAPTVFRYRILIHDGHPDGELDEQVWRDFAEPPTVTVEPGLP